MNHQKLEGITESAAGAEAKRVAARRRFLKGGTGASAVVLTVLHKRAFAATTVSTVKKGAIASACVSLQGIPDIKGITQKKALQLSAMGTPKGLMCRAKPVTNTCTFPQDKADKFDQYGNKTQIAVYSNSQLKDGCGYLDDTVANSHDFRLYSKHYCPVVQNISGDLTYDTNATYYDNKGKLQKCQ
jgi:hypothetical protein